MTKNMWQLIAAAVILLVGLIMLLCWLNTPPYSRLMWVNQQWFDPARGSRKVVWGHPRQLGVPWEVRVIYADGSIRAEKMPAWNGEYTSKPVPLVTFQSKPGNPVAKYQFRVADNWPPGYAEFVFSFYKP